MWHRGILVGATDFSRILFCPYSGRRVGRKNAVSIATPFGLDGPGIESRWGGDENFRTCPDWPWGLPNLLYNGYWGFPGGKTARAWRWQATPARTEVKERVELYIYSTSGPLWPVIGWTVLYLYVYSGLRILRKVGVIFCGRLTHLYVSSTLHGITSPKTTPSIHD